jgi:rhodanese-related sulfurtransferase
MKRSFASTSTSSVPQTNIPAVTSASDTVSVGSGNPGGGQHTRYAAIREKQLEEERLAAVMAGSVRHDADTTTDDLDRAYEVTAEILRLKSCSTIYERLQESAIPYIEQDELEALLSDGGGHVIVVDTREEDRCGGHIKGSVHCPGNEFWQHVERLVQMLEAKQTVVFHCMESVMRGPRCALALDAFLCITQKEADHPRICVLKGGFDKWCRKHHANPALVDGFDDDFWGFDDWQEDEEEDEKEDSATDR